MINQYNDLFKRLSRSSEPYIIQLKPNAQPYISFAIHILLLLMLKTKENIGALSHLGQLTEWNNQHRGAQP